MELSNRVADFMNDRKILDRITSLEKELSMESGKNVVLVAYDVNQQR